MMGGGSSGHGGSGEGHAPQQTQQQQEMSGQQPQYAQQQDFSQQQQNPCEGFNMNFVQCLKQNTGEISMCQEYMNMLQQCERDNFSKFS